jgi:hypothetical protein
VTRALTGHTGFVGGNLLRQDLHGDLYHSSNVAALAGRSFERALAYVQRVYGGG